MRASQRIVTRNEPLRAANEGRKKKRMVICDMENNHVIREMVGLTLIRRDKSSLLNARPFDHSETRYIARGD